MVTPNIQTVDLAMIRESPSQTSDVKFIFKDRTTGEVKELLAHKLVLAVGSVGSLKENKDTIPVEDVSFEAFKILLDMLYNKKVALTEVSLALLAEVYSLADKYLLGKMQDSVIQNVASRKMRGGMLIEAGRLAEDYLHMEKFSENLYMVCAKFIKKNVQEVLEIFESEEVGGANSMLLHRLMAKASKVKGPSDDASNKRKLKKYDDEDDGNVSPTTAYVNKVLMKRRRNYGNM
jgi:hypothetical protein